MPKFTPGKSKAVSNFRAISWLSKMSIDQILIGKFPFMTRLSQKALRLYDRKGLLVPEAEVIKGIFYLFISL